MILIRCFLIATFLFSNLFTYAAASDFLLTLQGSNTIGAKLAPQLARQFMQARGFRDVSIQAGSVENEFIVSGKKSDGNGWQYGQIKVTAHGSGTGYIALQKGMADIAMSSRPIKPAEVLALKDTANMRAAWIEHAIAIDGLAILVSPQNPVESLTIIQLAKIFSGEITNWKEVGGNDAVIHLYARDEKSGTWDTFKELVLGSEHPLAASAQRFESSDVLSGKVANDVAGIGFSGLASVHNAKVLGIADEGTGAIRPGSFSVATEDYPLSRRLYLYTPDYLGNDQVREFVEFSQSETGQHIVAETGFVSQNIQPYIYAAGDDAPEDYKNLSATAKRLSLNFRFDEGSPRLDNKAYRDLDRLVDYLQKPENKGLKVYLAGFSDAKNNPALDRVLSRFRALAVKSVLMEEGLAVEEVQALGAYNPVASNKNSMVKNRNGRVEVWVMPVVETNALVKR